MDPLVKGDMQMIYWRSRSTVWKTVTLIGVAALLLFWASGNVQWPQEATAQTSLECLPGQPYPAGTPCEPTGAHDAHSGFDCRVCHVFGGVLGFAPNGPAVPAGSIVNGSVVPGAPLPGFNNATKTCSSVACHGVPAGTYSYWVEIGYEEWELRTVSYGGTMASETPSWYSTGGSCTACHGNPPPAYPAWHGWHANRSFANANDCQLCHPSAIGANGVGTAITNLALHGNGTVDMTPQWRSSCFNCH
jgi:hypothetical protein